MDVASSTLNKTLMSGWCAQVPVLGAAQSGQDRRGPRPFRLQPVCAGGGARGARCPAAAGHGASRVQGACCGLAASLLLGMETRAFKLCAAAWLPCCCCSAWSQPRVWQQAAAWRIPEPLMYGLWLILLCLCQLHGQQLFCTMASMLHLLRDTENGCVLACTHTAQCVPPLDHAPIRQNRCPAPLPCTPLLMLMPVARNAGGALCAVRGYSAGSAGGGLNGTSVNINCKHACQGPAQRTPRPSCARHCHKNASTHKPGTK